MLIEFTTSNHLSISDPVSLSLEAAGRVSEFKEENTFRTGKLRLLKTAVIYGANASGKSNVLESLVWMRRFVINSHKNTQAGEPLDVSPFKLDLRTMDQPSHFEVLFMLDDVRYRYGFELDGVQIRKEWLFRKVVKEAKLFVRIDDEIEVGDGFSEGKPFVENTRNNALFLSTMAGLNGSLSVKLLGWFQRMIPIHGLKPELYHRVSVDMLKNSDQRTRILNILKKADLGIQDLRVEDSEMEAPQAMMSLFSEKGREIFQRDYASARATRIYSRHKQAGNDSVDGEIEFDFLHEESNGTRKFFSVIGPVLRCLDEGSVLVADELEAELHPLLTRLLVRMFHSPVTNPKNAQMIFATHDANLLQYAEFRRDQIWFTEKNRQQATELYALSEIKLPANRKTVRKDASYEKDYFAGRYGGVPFLGDFESLFEAGPAANG